MKPLPEAWHKLLDSSPLHASVLIDGAMLRDVGARLTRAPGTAIWKLRELPASDAHPAITLSPESHAGFIILEGDGQQLTGYAGCQPMNALYNQQGAHLRIKGLTRTGSRCHKEKFDEVGDRFATALSTATGYRMANDDALLHILNGETVTATLIYRTPPKGSW